jgi:hypothetical protein
MPVLCSVCTHPQTREISTDLFSGMSYRAIQKRYGVKPTALCVHLREHVAAPLRRLCEAERRLADDAALVAPSLLEMRKLNERTLRILSLAEVSKDYDIALRAIGESRRNMELISRLTGELDPQSVAEDGKLEVRITYVDRPLPEPARIIEALPAPSEDKPN